MSENSEGSSWFDHIKHENVDRCEQGLYREHEVKPELVLGPELLQPQDVAYSILRQFGPLIKIDKDPVNQVSKSQFRDENLIEPYNARFTQDEQNIIKQELLSKTGCFNELEKDVLEHKQEFQGLVRDPISIDANTLEQVKKNVVKEEAGPLSLHSQYNTEHYIDSHCIQVEKSSLKQCQDSQDLHSGHVILRSLEHAEKNTVKEEQDSLTQFIDEQSNASIQRVEQDSVLLKKDSKAKNVKEKKKKVSSVVVTGYVVQSKGDPVKEEADTLPFNTRCIEQLLTPCLVKVDRLPDMKAPSPIFQSSPQKYQKNPDMTEILKEYTLEISGEPFVRDKNYTSLSGNITNYAVKNVKKKHVAAKMKYHCEMCGEKFTAKRKLKIHLRVHKEKPKINTRRRVIKKKYKCDRCGRRFAEKTKLIPHILVHMGFKPYACETCGREFSTSSRLVKHEGAHIGLRPYICDICGNRYSCKSSISLHIMRHMDIKLHTCKICDKRFVTNSSLRQHEVIHTGTKLYTCELCQKQFKRRTNLNLHILTHVAVKEIICEICGNAFKSARSLKNHKLIHEGIKPYPCEFCRKKYRTGYAMRRHTKRVHNKENTRVVVGLVDLLHSTDINDDKQIQTQEILDTNEVKENLTDNNHEGEISTPLAENSEKNNVEQETNNEEQVSFQKPVEMRDVREMVENLPKCPSHCTDTLQVQARKVEIPLATSPVVTKTVNVSKSGSQDQNETSTVRSKDSAFDVSEITTMAPELNKNERDNHTAKETIVKLEVTLEIEEDEEKKPYSCDTCGKRYAKKNQLIPHFRVHTGEFRCEICDKTFAYDCYLSKHKNKHVEKPMRYSCEVCKMKFRGIRSLQAHSRIHTGEKLHPCKLCDKQFNAGHTLRAHMRTHTGEKPYFCDICNKQFGQHGNLARHKRTQHSVQNKPYSCDICHKRFVTRAYANIHKKIHTGEKFYTCEVCSKKFLHGASYRSHKKLHAGPREKKYTCKICNAKFYSSCHLSRHHHIHTGVKPFSCDLCGKRFYCRAHLGRHTRNQKRPCVD